MSQIKILYIYFFILCMTSTAWCLQDKTKTEYADTEIKNQRFIKSCFKRKNHPTPLDALCFRFISSKIISEENILKRAYKHHKKKNNIENLEITKFALNIGYKPSLIAPELIKTVLKESIKDDNTLLIKKIAKADHSVHQMYLNMVLTDEKIHLFLLLIKCGANLFTYSTNEYQLPMTIIDNNERLKQKIVDKLTKVKFIALVKEHANKKIDLPQNTEYPIFRAISCNNADHIKILIKYG